MFRQRMLTVGVAAVMIGTLAAGPAGAITVAHVKVGANGSTFTPKIKSVSAPTKVVWKDVSGTHTVTAYRGNWSKNVTLSPGETTAFTFRSRGTYKYRCTFHSTLSGGVCSGMCGVIKVG